MVVTDQILPGCDKFFAGRNSRARARARAGVRLTQKIGTDPSTTWSVFLEVIAPRYVRTFMIEDHAVLSDRPSLSPEYGHGHGHGYD